MLRRSSLVECASVLHGTCLQASNFFYSSILRNTIFRKALPSVVSGYGERSINLNKVVATFEKYTFLSQTDLTRTGIISNMRGNDEIQNVQRKKTWIFILWELHSKILVGDKNLL
jgi:hypothetical protein